MAPVWQHRSVGTLWQGRFKSSLVDSNAAVTFNPARKPG